MKRVLVLNGDSFVGERVVRQFYAAREYEIEVTRSPKDSDEESTLAYRKRNQGEAASVAHRGANASMASVVNRLAAGEAATAVPQLRKLRRPPPSYLAPYVTAVVPSYNAEPLDFCTCVLENDIIVAVLDEDATEAECAIKALMNSHYEVEKTFVLVSSALTWANTLIAERTIARQTRKKQRDDARRAYWEEALSELEADGASETDEEVVALRRKLAEPQMYMRDEDLPAEMREPVEEVGDEELVPAREFSEEEYTTRVSHPRYQHYKALEHVVKHANSATLHTYVLFAGLPYGAGEGPLYSYFLSAFQHTAGKDVPLASLLLEGNPEIAEHVVPMIHVEDLAALIFKVGSAYDVGDERYLFAVDRGNLTVRRLLQAIDARLGAAAGAHHMMAGAANGYPSEETMVNYLDASTPAPPTIEALRAKYENDMTHPLFRGGDSLRCFLLSDIRAEPGTAFNYFPEENWVAVEGFAEAIDKVAFQYKKERGLQPCRLLVTGALMTGSETLAASLACQYGVPFLTIDAVTAEFKAHTASLRRELVELLAKRMKRRWSRAHMLRVKAVMAERAEKAARIAEAKAERKRLRQEEREARREAGEDVDDDDDDDDDEDDEDEDDEDEEGDGDEEGSEKGSSASSDAVGKGDGNTSELSLVFSEDKEHTERRLAEVLTERYVQGYTEDAEDGDVELAPEDDEEEEEDEQMFTQAEDDAAQEEGEQEEDGNAGAVRGRIRALASIRAAELQERIRIRSLRLEYRLALRALSMKLVNGSLPRPKKEDEEEEEEEEEGSEFGNANDDEEEEEEDGKGDEESGNGEEGEGSGEGSEGEEEGDADSAELSENSSVFSAGRRNQVMAAKMNQQKQKKGKVFPTANEEEYLDEAKTFFMRWRLRQPDCRNQGYVMHNFPSSVRQACLLYYASSPAEEEDESEADEIQPLLPPATVEDVMPPIDADFPFPNLESYSEEQLRELEEDVATDRLRIVDPNEEGVLAAVQESHFPDHVIVLDDKDEALQALAAAVADEQAMLRPPNAEQQEKPRTLNVSVHGGGSVVLRQKASTVAKEADAASPLLPPSPEVNEREATLSAMADSFLVTGDTFYKQLSKYRKHHRLPSSLCTSPSPASAAAAGPSESLVTWLQSVQTREKVGATADPILVHAARKHLSVEEGDAAAEDEDEEGGGSGPAAPPPTARFAQVDILPSPPRDAATLRRELLAVLSQSQSLSVNRTGTNTAEDCPLMVVAPNRPDEAPSGGDKPNKTRKEWSRFSQAEQPLQWLAEKLTRTLLPTPILENSSLVPPQLTKANSTFPSVYLSQSAAGQGAGSADGAAASQLPPSDRGDAADEAVERSRLEQLRRAEEAFHETLEKREEADVRLERIALRHAQVKEQCLGAWAAAQMPKEAYLMKYVLPHLTPAMQKVVRLRPEDPVTALADLLYNYSSDNHGEGVAADKL